MTEQQMNYMIALVEESSFSKAASRLYVSQPSISQLIKKLENQIGTPLLERGRRKIVLTPAGESFYQTAKKIQAAERQLDNFISDIQNCDSGTIRIGTTPFRASCMLSDSIIHFRKLHPGVQVQIIIDDMQHLQARLQDGDIDFCIEANSFDYRLFRTEALTQETYYLAVSPDSSFNQNKESSILTYQDICHHSERLFTANPLTLSACENLPFLYLGEHATSDELLNQFCAMSGYSPNLEYQVHSLEVMFHWITANYGIGLLPDTFIRFSNYKIHPNYYKINDQTNRIGLAEKEIVIAYTPKHFFTRASKEYLSMLKHSIRDGCWRLNANP